MKHPFILRLFKRDETLTAEQRYNIRSGDKERLSWDRFKQFPVTWIADFLHGHGIVSLEALRWWNQNKYNPYHFWKYKIVPHKWYPPNVYDRTKLYLYSKGLLRTKDRLGHVTDPEELKAFLGAFKCVEKHYGKGDYAYTSVTYRNGPWWHTVPGDHIFTREIVVPGTNPRYLNGAVGIRFDDDFFTTAVIPYRFKGLDCKQIVNAIWPDIEDNDMTITPDSGTPELKAYYGDDF